LHDADVLSGEACLKTSVAELADGDEGAVGKRWKDVGFSSGERKVGEV
jgi:hypothetical protein